MIAQDSSDSFAPSSSHHVLVKKWVWFTAMALVAVAVLYPIGYVALLYCPIPQKGPLREAIAFVNRTVYYPIHYVYRRIYWQKEVPFYGTVTGQFLRYHQRFGYLRCLKIGNQVFTDKSGPIVMFSAFDREDKESLCYKVYHKALKDYLVWYDEAVRNRANPDPYVDPIPLFWEAVFQVTYTHQILFYDVRGHGETEIKFISIERVAGEEIIQNGIEREGAVH